MIIRAFFETVNHHRELWLINRTTDVLYYGRIIYSVSGTLTKSFTFVVNSYRQQL